MAAGAIDVCNFDASWSGARPSGDGSPRSRSSYGLSMGHHEEPQVASHLVASIPHGTFVECFHPDRDPIWWNLPANRPRLRDGMLQLSEQPGLGWELDAEFIERTGSGRGRVCGRSATATGHSGRARRRDGRAA